MDDVAEIAPADAPKTATVTGGFTGFLAVAAGTRVTARLYGASEAAEDALLFAYDDAQVHVMLMGRLYYREEARAQIGLSSRADAGNDAALAAHAYLQSGVEGLTRLEGEFCLLLHDKRARRLVAMRDPMGGYPIYWRRAHGELAIGTSVRLLNSPDARGALADAFFAEFLTHAYFENDYFTETPIGGIHRLPSGSLLIAERDGEPRVQTYWNWLDRIDDPGVGDVGVIAERYRELLDAATRERLRGRTAAHLSGGLDSTTTALLAARASGNVEALCLVYERFRDLALETPYLESALDRPGIRVNRIVADDILDYDNFSAMPAVDEPYSGLYRTGVHAAMIEVARARGCGTVLTGIGADEMLDGAPFHMGDMLRRGEVMGAWREGAGWARLYNTDPWRIFRFFALRPLMPPFLQPGLGPLLRSGYAREGQERARSIPSWVRRDFAARGKIQGRIHRNLAAASRSGPTLVASDALGRLRQSCGDWVRYNLGAPRGVHVAHPFRDPRVLAFGFGARLRVRPSPTQQKIILAQAVRDVLPEKILSRPDKGHYNAISYAGLARNAGSLQAMLHDADIGAYFDRAALQRALQENALGYRHAESKIGLDNSLIIAKWISLLPQWRAWSARPSRTIRHDDCF